MKPLVGIKSKGGAKFKDRDYPFEFKWFLSTSGSIVTVFFEGIFLQEGL